MPTKKKFKMPKDWIPFTKGRHEFHAIPLEVSRSIVAETRRLEVERGLPKESEVLKLIRYTWNVDTKGNWTAFGKEYMNV